MNNSPPISETIQNVFNAFITGWCGTTETAKVELKDSNLVSSINAIEAIYPVKIQIQLIETPDKNPLHQEVCYYMNIESRAYFLRQTIKEQA